MTKLFTETDLEDPVEIVIPEDAPLSPFIEKYKDEKGVAKAIVEKDTFIARLQRENAEFRAKQVNEGNVAEIVDRLLASRNNTPNPELGTAPGSQQSEQPQTPSGLSIADVEKLLAQREQQSAAKTNADKVRSELENLYGPNWVNEVKKKAKEIGESLEFFESLAQTKPAVMLKLFTPQTEAPKPTLFNGTVNTTAATLNAGTQTQRTMKYYKDIRAKDPIKYQTPAVQNQMHKDALQLRDAFFDA
jgi:hypothetical protein